METPSKMTTPAANADGTKKVPEALPSREKKQGMETPSKMTTPAANADGTKKVPEALPSREKNQGMETPSKMTTPAANADDTKKVPGALPSPEKKQGMETPIKMTTPVANADDTKKVPEALPSPEKKQGMETPIKMTTPAANADGIKKVPKALPSREKKQGMETPSKMTTPAANADGTKKVSEALPSREKKQGMETPSKMTTPAADADGTQKVPQALLSLVKELGMEEYYPCKLSLQELRTLDIPPEHANEGPPTKQDLARGILKELMLTNTQCREEVIRNFSKLAQPKTQKYAFGTPPVGKSERTGRKSEVPHPMDVLQVLFMCSDFEVRQILAQKLFLCRLAIPFILPYTHQLLLWPLRPIVLEWNDDDECKEEALVKCKVNMVAFMRFGANSFSKSNLLNQVLSASGHATFFHRGSPCGGEKRVTSDGMVEMSHFLPAAKRNDSFKQPALFFNLRGDACSYEVPRQVLLKLATVLVLMLDISQLCHTKVQDMLKETVAQKRKRTVLVLTDNNRHSQSDIDDINARFCELLADDIKNVDIVATFEEQQITSSLIEDVSEAVSKNMTKQPSVSLEEHVTSHLLKSCEVDEENNEHCSKGKELADSILKDLSKEQYDKLKETFLPKQGECLNGLSKALRNLNRTSKKEQDTGNIREEKEAIRKKIDSIREIQRKATGHQTFTKKLIALFREDRETREFAKRWVQLSLDEQSRLHLPGMHKEKNDCWRKLIEARSNGDSEKSLEDLKRLEEKLQRQQEKIASATCGWEHLMRELGQMYEADDPESPEYSFLPRVLGQQLFDGHPVELMDGDHGIVPIAWIKAVFQSLAQLAGNKKILVLSVLGIQSSGKSTLLNTMFGLEFAVSAGRCTRGIYAQLLPVRDSNQRFHYLLVLDSEGLRSQQREAKYQFDNELATLVIGFSDIAMINLKGENIAEMADVLEIVVHAFLRMRLADSPQKRQCMFVHQNVPAVNAQEKLADDRQMLQEKLNAMTKQASEALGLSEAIKSFNRIINFDSQQDVVYFPDLWKGDPPMAAINQEYSRKAGATQHTIFQRLTRQFNSFISMEDFVTRTEDMWNGVLSDDFIFSFRNTLAAKAYIDVEKEICRLTLDMERKLRTWMNSQCEPKIRSSNTEQELKNHWTEIEENLPKKINICMEEKRHALLDFFEKHDACDVIEQWKTEKILSLQHFGQELARQIRRSLLYSKSQKSVKLRTNTDIVARQKEIQSKAIELAEKLREKKHKPDTIDEKFDELWENWETDLTSGCTNAEVNVHSEFKAILWERFTKDEGQYLDKQLDLTPLAADSNAVFNDRDISAEHISVKENSSWKKMWKNKPKESDFFLKALQIANDIMRRTKQKIDVLSDEQVAMNTAMHGKEVLDEVWRALEEHNKLPYDQAGFALTPEFKAMVAVRASCVAVERFEAMTTRFEDQHGIRAQLADYKQQTYVLFKGAFDQASAEIKAAKYICSKLKTEVEKLTINKVKTNLGENIRNAVGTRKQDFIITILDEIADKKDYASLKLYVENPSQYAEQWLERYVEKHLFGEGETNYSKDASYQCWIIVDAIKTSMVNAIADIQPGSSKYEQWLEKFCRHVEETMFINPSQFQVDEISSVQDLINFQSLLTSGMEESQEKLLKEFRQTKQVSWLKDERGNIFQNWWGCEASCPFCGEPCQFQNHEGCHKCIQHKSPAARGVCQMSVWQWYLSYPLPWLVNKNNLAVDSCDFSVSTISRFRFEGKDEWHSYRDYKEYFPKWDIPPNASGDGGKYWQWAVATLHEKLKESHSGKTLKLPDQWKRITPEEAKESLRKW